MTDDDLAFSHMISSAITSTLSCASPNVFADPSTVTSAPRSASVISPHASRHSTTHFRSEASAHFSPRILSRLS